MKVSAPKADLVQSPRLQDAEGKRGQGSENPAFHLTVEGHASAGRGTVLGPNGDNSITFSRGLTVARCPRCGAENSPNADYCKTCARDLRERP